MSTNLTRDPFHPNVASNYVRNMNELKIYVGGELMNSRRILNVNRLVFGKEPHVQRILEDSEGNIRLSSKGKLLIEDVFGPVVIQGIPDHCGCWTGRQVADWHKRIDRDMGAW